MADYDPKNPFVLMEEQLRHLRTSMGDMYRAHRDQTLATRDLTDAIVSRHANSDAVTSTLIDVIRELTTEMRAMLGEREARAEAREAADPKPKTGNGHAIHLVPAFDDEGE